MRSIAVSMFSRELANTICSKPSPIIVQGGAGQQGYNCLFKDQVGDFIRREIIGLDDGEGVKGAHRYPAADPGELVAYSSWRVF